MRNERAVISRAQEMKVTSLVSQQYPQMCFRAQVLKGFFCMTAFICRWATTLEKQLDKCFSEIH